MPKKTEQEQKEAAREFNPSQDDLLELIKDCNGDASKARDASNTWRNRLADNYRRRRGLIGKEDPDFPFKNSSDLRFRSEERKLRKVNSAFVLSIMSAPKIARFIPLDGAHGLMADDHEYLLQWQMLGQDKQFQRKVKLLANQRNHHGPCVVKIIWDHQSIAQTQVFTKAQFVEMLKPYEGKWQQAMQGQNGEMPKFGERELKAAIADLFGWTLDNKVYQKRIDKALEQLKDEKTDTIRIIVNRNESRPLLTPITDLTLFTVPVDTGALQEAEWIAHDIPMSERELRQRKSKYKNVDKVLELIKEATRSQSSEDNDLYQEAIRHASGVTEEGSIIGFVYVREMYRWIPRKYISRWKGEEDDEEAPVKAVITYCPELGDESPVLRIMELPYDHGMWPFEEDVFNLSEDNFYNSEGLGQMLAPYSSEFDTSRNAAIDRHSITLSPLTLIWNQSKIVGSSFRQLGQVMYTPIPPERAIHIPQWGDLSRGFELDAQKIDADMDEVAGVPSLSSLSSYGTPPTKEQIDQTVGPANAIQAMELSSWTDFWGRICNHFFELNKQFLFPLIDQRKGLQVPRMMGGGFVKITPQHFQGEYFIQCGADVNRTNPMFETQKLVAWIQMMKADPATYPFVKWFDAYYLLAVRMIGHIDSQTVLMPREQAEQLNKQYMDAVVEKKAQMEIQMQKAKERGAAPRGQKGMGGGMTEMTGANQGLFPKSVGV